MRFAENNRISHRQLYRQMILALLAPFMLCVFGKGGMNGISAVAGMIFALILLGFYVIWLIRLTPSFEDPVKSAGAFAGRLIAIFFSDLCVDGRGISAGTSQEAGSCKADHRSIRPMDRILGGSGMFCRNLQRCTEKRKNGGSIRWSASWRDYDNDDTLCATGKNGISHGRNPVGGAYSDKCPSVFLWNSVCFFAGCIAAIFVGKCGEIRKCGKDGGRRDPDTWRDSYWNGASASGSSGI